MKFADVVLSKAVLSDFEENAYVVSLVGRDDCVIVDPGMEPETLIEQIRQNRLTPKAILITHGHWDHVGGVSDVRKVWPDVPIYIGENDRSKLADPNGNLSAPFGYPATTCDADRGLKDGDKFELVGIPFQTAEIPGHTRGHVLYRFDAEERPVVFCGDAVFAGSVGRSDFADGDGAALMKSISDKILTLPDSTLLCPGHGPETSVREEKRSNPYFQHLLNY